MELYHLSFLFFCDDYIFFGLHDDECISITQNPLAAFNPVDGSIWRASTSAARTTTTPLFGKENEGSIMIRNMVT